MWVRISIIMERKRYQDSEFEKFYAKRAEKHPTFQLFTPSYIYCRPWENIY